MKKLVIRGGKPLNGEITINGAKNSTVALIPAAIIADSPVVLEGVPDIQDVHSLLEILAEFNVKTEFKNNVLTAYIDGEIDHDSAAKIRARIDGAAQSLKPKQLCLDFSGIPFILPRAFFITVVSSVKAMPEKSLISIISPP